MRIKKKIDKISYKDTHIFFDNRVSKYNDNNPYSVTMYQDNNPDLVKERNIKEVETIIPQLRLDEKSRVLDVACGIGRWSDAIKTNIALYCGIDFCEGLIKLAKERNKERNNRLFYVSDSVNLLQVLNNNEGCFNRVLFIGSLMYLNDEDVNITLNNALKVCEKKTIICVREPIGVEERLTLKQQFSEELKDTYNAIYRTREDLNEIFDKTLICNGFKVKKEGFLFGDSNLNNRKETAQYYYILERE